MIDSKCSLHFDTNLVKLDLVSRSGWLGLNANI